MDGPSDDSRFDTSRGIYAELASSNAVTERGICSYDYEFVSSDEYKWWRPWSSICYVWFVPSPSMSITQGITKTLCINNLVCAGFKVKTLIADWVAPMKDHRVGTDLENIRKIGLYNIEVWRAVGIEIDKVEFVWLSDTMNSHADFIWGIVRCSKTTTDPHTPTKVPLHWFQCAAMLFNKGRRMDSWLLDEDQRDVADLAKKYTVDKKWVHKPSFMFSKMLPDLLKNPEFSAWSDTSRAISMEDEERHVHFKIMIRAFCPPKVEGNPCLAYVEHIIFTWFREFEIQGEDGAERSKTFRSMQSLVADYIRGTLHPTDVKRALEKALNKMLQPVRDHFENNTYATDLWKVCAGILYDD